MDFSNIVSFVYTKIKVEFDVLTFSCKHLQSDLIIPKEMKIIRMRELLV